MSYRPITDTWILARAKLKGERRYYGAYPGGFPERARALLGVTLNDPVLHVCGGMARHYPYPNAFGPHDKTLDLDPATEPDFCQDARGPLPVCEHVDHLVPGIQEVVSVILGEWPAILIDPPYTEGDAEKYTMGAGVFPSANLLVKNAIAAVRIGGRVGILHYLWPSPPKNARSVAAVAVLCGFNNRVRLYSVFERTT